MGGRRLRNIGNSRGRRRQVGAGRSPAATTPWRLSRHPPRNKSFISNRHVFSAPHQGAECMIRVESISTPLTSPCLGGRVIMGNRADLWARHRTAGWLCAALLAVASFVFLPLAASAQETAIIHRGDAAVTAFSGAQVGEVPPDVHPLDVTFIDTSGAVLQVFDLTQARRPAGRAARQCAVDLPGDGRRRSARCSASRSTATPPTDARTSTSRRHRCSGCRSSPRRATASSRASAARAGCPASSASTRAAARLGLEDRWRDGRHLALRQHQARRQGQCRPRPRRHRL